MDGIQQLFPANNLTANTFSGSLTGPPSCKPAVFGPGIRRPTTVPPAPASRAHPATCPSELVPSCAPASRAHPATRPSELVPSCADDEEGRPSDDAKEPIPQVGCRPLVIQAVESELQLAKKAYSKALSEFARITREDAALLLQFPVRLARLVELDAAILAKDNVLSALKAKLAIGHTYGKGIDELMTPAIAMERAAFDAARAEQVAADDAFHAIKPVTHAYIAPPDLRGMNKKQRDEKYAAFGARVEAARNAAYMATKVLLDAAGHRIGLARDGATAAKMALEAAKVRELPLLEPRVSACIEAFNVEGNATANEAKLLAQRLISALSCTSDLLSLEKVVEVDAVHMAAFAPVEINVSTWSDVCALATHEAAFARLYPSGPNVASMLRKLEAIRTRPLPTSAQVVMAVAAAPEHPVERLSLGADGPVALRYTVAGNKPVSVQSKNACYDGVACRNIFCKYQHPDERDAAIAREQAARKERYESRHTAELSFASRGPRCSGGAGRMTRKEKADDKLDIFLTALSLCKSSASFLSLENDGITKTDGSTIAKGMCIAKVVKVPGGGRLQIMLLNGELTQCIRKKGIDSDVGDVILIEARKNCASIDRSQRQVIEAKLVQLQVPFDQRFFGHVVEGGARLDDIFEDAVEVAPKTVSSSPASRIVFQSLPDDMLPPMEDEYEEEDEAAEAPVLTVAALPAAEAPVLTVAALPAAVEAPESDAEDSDDEGISALVPTGKKPVKKGKKGGKGGR